MKNKLLQTCLFLTLIGLLLITPIGKVKADTTWNLQLTTIAGTTVNYSYDQLLAMPMTNVSGALYCYGNIVTFGVWGGVSLSYLLQQAGLDPAVASIDFLAKDGYQVQIPLQIAEQNNTIIAYDQDGSPLPQTLRLVVPDLNGAVWIDLITSITMNTALIDISQFLASNAGGPSQIPTVSSLKQPSSQLQQQPVQAQPTAAPTNQPTIEPTTPPTNTTQPNQTTPPQQASSPKTLGFPVAVVYGIALGATAALVTASYLVLSRRRIKK